MDWIIQAIRIRQDEEAALSKHLHTLLRLEPTNRHDLTAIGFAIGVLISRAQKDPELRRRLKG